MHSVGIRMRTANRSAVDCSVDSKCVSFVFQSMPVRNTFILVHCSSQTTLNQKNVGKMHFGEIIISLHGVQHSIQPHIIFGYESQKHGTKFTFSFVRFIHY